ncbi:hypothetical protein PG993_006182 [Apiospora rasikravindrae]|uniref:Uncharacterized protein n=1 Tax=Apiospora rasikravindrae TaxID=990691 RepID=A0ABR1T732_9PEZI
MPDGKKNGAGSAPTTAAGRSGHTDPPTRDVLNDFIDKLAPCEKKHTDGKRLDEGIKNPPTVVWAALPNDTITTIVPGAAGISVCAQMFLDRVAERIGDYSDKIGIDACPVKHSEGDFIQYTLYICRDQADRSSWVQFGDKPPIPL